MSNNWINDVSIQDWSRKYNPPGYKMKKSDVIKAKHNILKKLELDKTTNVNIRTLCQLFLSDYMLYKWKCDDIESLVNVVRDLLNSNNEEDLIIVVEILKNLQRK